MSWTEDEVWHPYRPGLASFAALDTGVHVWRVGLDAVPAQAGEVLSADERDRAQRFARLQDRQRFVAGRAVLRSILAEVLDIPSGAPLRFGDGSAGKPVLRDAPGLHFNLSHSEELAVIAVTRAGEVGIDLERHRPLPDMASVARVLFTEAEQAAMLGCPASAREAVFYRIWTRKEALLKAMGLGIAGLDPEAVPAGPTGSAWLMTMLPGLDGFTAALARPHRARGLRLWTWPVASTQRDERLAALRPASIVPLSEADRDDQDRATAT